MKLIANQNVSAMIFAAGYGKRLRPYTEETPKPLLPFKGANCLTLAVNALKSIGFLNIVINAHHLHNQIVDYFKDDSSINVIVEEDLLETGGGLFNASRFLNDYILTINGDIWLQDYSLINRLIESFEPASMDILLYIVKKENALYFKGDGDYFLLDEPAKKQACHIRHKGDLKEAPYIYTGIQIIKKSFFQDNLPMNNIFSLRHHFDCAQKKGTLFGLEYNDNWCDIGNIEVYEKMKNK